MGQCRSQTHLQKEQYINNSTNKRDENSVHSMSLFTRQYVEYENTRSNKDNNTKMSIYILTF